MGQEWLHDAGLCEVVLPTYRIKLCYLPEVMLYEVDYLLSARFCEAGIY
jgi:hypothetical protein